MSGASFAAIEAGGTKFALAVGEDPTRISATHTIPTRSPTETLGEAREWFESQGSLKAMGIASFGPVELDRASAEWGHILKTPKPGWSNCDLAGYFERAFSIPVIFDTDVNGAALGEYLHGAGKGACSLTYVTIGTGIGGGTIIDGRVLHGAGHPELGHAYPRRGANDRDFAGVCPFHGDCLEGLASGPAISARWGATLSDLPQDHEAHETVAGYLAQMCHGIFAAVAVETIILGGGVMNTPGLLDRIVRRARDIDRGYFPARDRQRIVKPALAGRSGLVGSMALAVMAAD